MNKVRTEIAKFRVTPEELYQLDNLAWEAGKLTRSEILRKLCLEKEVVMYDFSKLDTLSYEIGKIGVNINQIARKLNQGDNLTKDNAEFLLTSMETINKSLAKIYVDVLEKKKINSEDS